MPTIQLPNAYDPAAPLTTIYNLKTLLEALTVPIIGRAMFLGLMVNPNSPAGAIWMDYGQKPSGATNPSTDGVLQVETATVVATIPTATAQIETATVAGTIGAAGAGNATVTVTGALVTGSPLVVPVAVANNDTADQVAGKIRTALGLLAAITTNYTVSGATDKVILTANAPAANDTTLNIATDNGTCTGLTAAPTSANTQVGIASGAGNAQAVVTAAGMVRSPKTVLFAVADGDDSSGVAGKARTALAADADVAAFFVVSGATDKIILTARSKAANDTTLNIATANATSTGITAAPTSANTTAGVALGSRGVDLTSITQGFFAPPVPILPENVWLSGQVAGALIDVLIMQN